MKALRIILGILMIFGSVSVITMPAVTTIMMCWFISFFMLVGGIIGIVNYIEAKNAEKVAKKSGLPYLETGIGSLLLAIACVVLGILSRSSIVGEELFIQIISVVFGTWITLKGISFIVCGWNFKKIAAPGWLSMILMGLLIAAAGIFCIVNSFASLVAIGTMFGISMMITGVSLMFE